MKKHLTFQRNSKVVTVSGRIRGGKNVAVREMLHKQEEHFPERKHIIIDLGQQIAMIEDGVCAEGSLHPRSTLIYDEGWQWEHVRQQWSKYRFHVVQTPDISVVDDVIPFMMEAGGCNIWIDEANKLMGAEGKGAMSKHKLHPMLSELLTAGAHFGTTRNVQHVKNPGDVGWFGVGASTVLIFQSDTDVHNNAIRNASIRMFTAGSHYGDNERFAKLLGEDPKVFHELRSSLIPPGEGDFVNGRPTRSDFFLRYDDINRVEGEEIFLLSGLNDPD